MREVDVVIQGAGIAGCALRKFLLAKGSSVILVENKSSTSFEGGGILLQENAITALAQIGISTSDLKRKNTVTAVNIGNETNESILRVDTGGSIYGISRSELVKSLLESPLTEDIIYNSSIEKFWHYDSSNYFVKLTDGQLIKCRWIVGCDGIRSAVREKLSGKKIATRYSRQCCWRLIVDGVTHNNEVYEIQLGRVRIGIVPIEKNQAYLYVVMNNVEPSEVSDWTWRDVKSLLETASPLSKTFAQQINHSTKLLFHPIVDAPVFMSKTPHIILIGDAAHPMTPNLGQGAAMALEDAVVLGHLLINNAEDPAKKFASIRTKRISGLYKLSHYAGVMSHIDNGWLQKAKWFSINLFPSKLAELQQKLFLREFHNQIKKSQLIIESE